VRLFRLIGTLVILYSRNILRSSSLKSGGSIMVDGINERGIRIGADWK
jgi:hypothetical protein